MIRKLISVSGILFLTSAFPGPAQSRSRQPKNSGITTKVDAYMKPVLDVNGFTGFVMVISRGKVLLSKGYGMANYELDVPNTAQTKFHLASVSKTFTAAAIMLLEERGLGEQESGDGARFERGPPAQRRACECLCVHGRFLSAGAGGRERMPGPGPGAGAGPGRGVSRRWSRRAGSSTTRWR